MPGLNNGYLTRRRFLEGAAVVGVSAAVIGAFTLGVRIDDEVETNGEIIREKSKIIGLDLKYDAFKKTNFGNHYLRIGSTVDKVYGFSELIPGRSPETTVTYSLINRHATLPDTKILTGLANQKVPIEWQIWQDFLSLYLKKYPGDQDNSNYVLRDFEATTAVHEIEHAAENMFVYRNKIPNKLQTWEKELNAKMAELAYGPVPHLALATDFISATSRASSESSQIGGIVVDSLIGRIRDRSNFGPYVSFEESNVSAAARDSLDRIFKRLYGVGFEDAVDVSLFDKAIEFVRS